jgi:hypothetical protein
MRAWWRLVPGSRSWGRILAGSVAIAATAAWAATDVHPAAGRHAVEFCVSTAAAAPNCGPAQAEVRDKGAIDVRIDDIVYRLKLHSSQVDIVVMHNATQIDEMTQPYEWSGATLEFNDDDRESHYEIRFAPSAKR